MGKRKSTRKIVVKKREKLDVQFDCPFCNESKSTEYRADKKANVGTIYCRSCYASFSQTINCLSAAIDVYDGWIEQIESNTSGPRSTHVEVESFKEQDRLGDDDDLFGGFDDEEIATYTKTTRLADQDDAEPDSRIENEELFGEEDIESELPENEHQKTTELDDSEDDFISSSRERVNSHRNRHLDDLESEREKHAKPQRKNVYIDSDEE